MDDSNAQIAAEADSNTNHGRLPQTDEVWEKLNSLKREISELKAIDFTTLSRGPKSADEVHIEMKVLDQVNEIEI